MKRTVLLLVTILLLASCSREVLSPTPDNGKGVPVSFSFAMTQLQVPGMETRATDPSTVDNTMVSDMWVFQFSNTGTLLKKAYFNSVDPTAFKVNLIPDNTGNLYFVANAGSSAFTTDPANETAFQSISRTISTEADLLLAGTMKYITMLGKVTGFTVPATGYPQTVTLPLTRILAQVDVIYSVDPSIASSFKLEKIRVCNVPKVMQYCTPAAGNFPLTPTPATVMNLDYINVTSSGTPQTLTYYLPDNSRGVGTNTPGTNARLKTGVAYATYIEMVGHTLGVQGGDEITYRVYPGADNYNDYNIVRNNHYTLTNNLIGVSVSDNRVNMRERANCYILKPGSSVLIPAKHANDGGLGTQITDVTSATAWTASAYWQTSAGLVLVDNSDHSLGCFKVTAPTVGTYGNAEVAVKDASGNVLWSWHIWVTDYDPATANDVINGNTWMQYNLGATAPANGTNSFATSGGLMYQWGRKDPFPNSNTTGNNVAPVAISGFVMPAYTGLTTTAVPGDNTYIKYADASQAAIGYANQLAFSIKYPMLFLTNWAGSTATAAASSTVGIDAWSGEYGQPKSVYDPCPEGWRVPSGKKTSSTWVSTWSTWTTNTAITTSNTAFAVWTSLANYPLTGQRDSGTGALTNVGSNGYYWSATATGASAYNLSLASSSVTNGASSNRPSGFNVRCVKTW